MWSKEVTIYCDHGNCNEWARVGMSKVGRTRDELSLHGWEYTNGLDYCPECAEK